MGKRHLRTNGNKREVLLKQTVRQNVWFLWQKVEDVWNKKERWKSISLGSRFLCPTKIKMVGSKLVSKFGFPNQVF